MGQPLKTNGVLFLALLFVSTSALASPARYGLIISNDDGDPGDAHLRYADSDAQHLAEVFQDVGGIAPEHLVVLHAATAERVRTAMREIKRSLTDADSEWVIYVSGHADQGSLHLGGTHLGFDELADFAKNLPVRLVVTVVDSCRSGTATRLKGLKVTGAPVVSVEAPVEGRVVIASSSNDEGSQESDVLKGSIFTHHFLAGLRGAADQSGDGEITVSEAYAYAKLQTVAGTFATTAGPQHPEFHVDLRGSGDLVLTDVKQARALFELLDDTPGTLGLLSQDSALPVTELHKARGPFRMALPPGRYQVWLRTEESTRIASFTLPSAGQVTLRARDLAVVTPQVARAKEGASPDNQDGVSASLGLAPMLATGAVPGVAPLFGMRARAHLRVRPDQAWFFAASVSVDSGAPASLGETEVATRLGAGLSHALGPVTFFAKLELGGVFIFQFGAGVESRRSLVPALTPTLGGELRLSSHFALMLEASLSGLWLVTTSGSRPAFAGDLCAGLAVVF